MKTTFATVALVAALGASAASASNMLADSVANRLVAEGYDVSNFSQVTPGEGRILHCMAAHADKISGRCEYAFYQAASILEQMAVAINYLATECQADIQTHCSDIAPGEGRILACLSDHDAEVSESCKTAIADTVEME